MYVGRIHRDKRRLFQSTNCRNLYLIGGTQYLEVQTKSILKESATELMYDHAVIYVLKLSPFCCSEGITVK